MRYYWVSGVSLSFWVTTVKKTHENSDPHRAFFHEDWLRERLERISLLGGQITSTERRNRDYWPFFWTWGVDVDLFMYFYFKTHHVLLPGSKYVIFTPCGFSVMGKVALWLTNEAKSDFPDVKGQDLKEREVRLEIGVCLLERRLSYVKDKI